MRYTYLRIVVATIGGAMIGMGTHLWTTGIGQALVLFGCCLVTIGWFFDKEV